MKQSFSLLVGSLLFAGCCSPIAELPVIENIKVQWMIPKEGDGTITYVYTDDFAMMYSVNGRLRINDKICREATK